MTRTRRERRCLQGCCRVGFAGRREREKEGESERWRGGVGHLGSRPRGREERGEGCFGSRSAAAGRRLVGGHGRRRRGASRRRTASAGRVVTRGSRSPRVGGMAPWAMGAAHFVMGIPRSSRRRSPRPRPVRAPGGGEMAPARRVGVPSGLFPRCFHPRALPVRGRLRQRFLRTTPIGRCGVTSRSRLRDAAIP